MRPIRQTVTGVGQTPPIPLDMNLNPFSVSLGVVLNNDPGVTYTVEYTESDVWAEGYDPDMDTWIPLDGQEDAVANSNTFLVSPVTAVRMRVTAETAPGDAATLTVLQGNAP